MKNILSESKDEIVDVVDEKDNVVGQESKLVCHANKFLHRGAAILIFKDESLEETLIQKRSMTKKSNPGQLAFTGGHLKAGESYLEGAKRELQEEMFHNQELPKLVFKELFKIKKFTDNDYEFMMVYLIIYPGPFSLDSKEVGSYHFENIHDLSEKVISGPENYTGTCKLLTREYKKRFL